jgi:serine/threonine protein kinase
LLYYIVIGQAPENAFVRLQKEATPLFSEALIEEISNASSIYLPELRSEEDPFESEAVVRESLLQPTFEIISLSFIEILEKGLSIDAEDRYTSMRELIALLEVFNTRSSTVYPLLLDIDQEKIHSDLILTKTVPVTTYGIKSFLVAKQEAKTASKPASIVESTSQPLPDEDIPTYKETSTQDIIQEVNDIYVEPSIDDSAQQASIDIEQELEIDEDRSNQQQEEFLDEESQDEVAKKDSIVELEDEAEEIDAISEEMDISEEINDVSEETDVVTEQIENDTIPMQNELLNSIIEAIGDKGRLQDESLEDEEVVVQPISVTVTNSTAPTINEVTKSLDDMWELLEKYEKQN